MGRIICLVGNGTDDDEGNTVEVSRVGNGSSFHLGTKGLGLANNGFLGGFFCHKQVAGGNSAPTAMQELFMRMRFSRVVIPSDGQKTISSVNGTGQPANMK